MKKIIVYSFLIMSCLCLTALSTADEVITKEFTVGGIKVIYKPSIKEIISVRLFIKGGTANYTKEQEGVETLALAVATQGGTKKLSMNDYQTALEKIGSSVGSSSTFDYSQIGLSCVKTYWDQSWNLFADAIMEPRFDPQSFDIIKGQTLTGAKEQEGNPDQHLVNKSMEMSFTGRNYAKIPNGSVTSLEKLTLDQTKAHFSKVVNKANSFLVVVGNVTEADITAKINATLAKLQQGTAAVVEAKTEIQQGVTIENRDIATNYIRGMMTMPALNEKDATTMRVAMAIMGDRFFVELRTKRSLTYAPGASFASAPIKNPYAVFYASSTNPKETLKVMMDEINNVKNQGFKEKELKDMKEGFLTGYYSRLETNDTQSMNLGTNEVAGSWKMVESFMGDVEKLKVEDLNKAFKKYSNAINWMYLGKQEAVAKDDFKQPQVLPNDIKVDPKK